MGCKGKNHSNDNCVCEVLKAVADAQDEVNPTNDDCTVSCHRSIQELLAGATTPRNELDTIPLILYCGDCMPFEGFGTRTMNRPGPDRIECFNSFYFRVTSVDENCCAKLELLATKKGGSDPCEQLKHFDGFYRTGICITVDLDCFCAVTCLDPVAALPLSRMHGNGPHEH